MKKGPHMPSTILQQAAQDGVALFNRIHSEGERIHPEFLAMHSCRAIILLFGKKLGCGFGTRLGHGYLIAKIDPTQPNEPTVRWTAPIFVRVKIAQFGLSLGFAESYSYMLAMSDKILKELNGKRVLFGVDSTFVAGTSTESKSDVISLAFGKDSDLIVAAVAKGVILDFSLAGGCMTIDTKAMQRAYGDHATMDAVLRGEIPPPQEMKPMYDFLSSMLQMAKVSPPHLVRASVERMTAGYEPDRRILTSGSARVLHRGDTGVIDLYERENADFDD